MKKDRRRDSVKRDIRENNRVLIIVWPIIVILVVWSYTRMIKSSRNSAILNAVASNSLRLH